jgi:hypothetical protein
MENKIEIIQTELMINAEFEGESYSVIFTEDKNPQSGYTSWEIYDDDGEYITDVDLESRIIAFVIENIS